jgi:hypothetical protein
VLSGTIPDCRAVTQNPRPAATIVLTRPSRWT